MVIDRRTGYLEELEHELDTRGLVARVVRTRSRPVFLRVVNPDAASLAEDITCAPAPESQHDHYYWWSWGERMHHVGDPGGAAVKLARVLQPLAAEPDPLPSPGARPEERPASRESAAREGASSGSAPSDPLSPDHRPEDRVSRSPSGTGRRTARPRPPETAAAERPSGRS